MIEDVSPHQIQDKTFAMEAENKTTLPDVQSSEDERNIAINRVGRAPHGPRGRRRARHPAAGYCCRP